MKASELVKKLFKYARIVEPIDDAYMMTVYKRAVEEQQRLKAQECA